MNTTEIEEMAIGIVEQCLDEYADVFDEAVWEMFDAVATSQGMHMKSRAMLKRAIEELI